MQDRSAKSNKTAESHAAATDPKTAGTSEGRETKETKRAQADRASDQSNNAENRTAS